MCSGEFLKVRFQLLITVVTAVMTATAPVYADCLSPSVTFNKPAGGGSSGYFGAEIVSDGSTITVHSDDLVGIVTQSLTPGYYSYEWRTKAVNLLSVLPDGSAAPGEFLGLGKISGDGRIFAFTVRSDVSNPGEVYVRDTIAGITTAITPEPTRSENGSLQSVIFGIDQVTSDGAFVSIIDFRVGDFSTTYIYDLASKALVTLPGGSFRTYVHLSRDGRSFSFSGSHAGSKALRGNFSRTVSADGTAQYRFTNPRKVARRINEVLTLPRTGSTYLARRALKSGGSSYGYRSKKGSFKQLVQCRYIVGDVSNPSADATRVLIDCDQGGGSYASTLIDLSAKRGVCLETGNKGLGYVVLSDDGSTLIARLDGKVVIYSLPALAA
jgi:hypothetical protein